VSVTVYVSIGNSDDKLTQAEWAQYVNEVRGKIHGWAKAVHGAWFSAPDSPWQNACWCAEFPDETYARDVRDAITEVRKAYRQDSVAWAVAETEFV
jgi:hypothetical protein